MTLDIDPRDPDTVRIDLLPPEPAPELPAPAPTRAPLTTADPITLAVPIEDLRFVRGFDMPWGDCPRCGQEYEGVCDCGDAPDGQFQELEKRVREHVRLHGVDVVILSY